MEYLGFTLKCDFQAAYFSSMQSYDAQLCINSCPERRESSSDRGFPSQTLGAGKKVNLEVILVQEFNLGALFLDNEKLTAPPQKKRKMKSQLPRMLMHSRGAGSGLRS